MRLSLLALLVLIPGASASETITLAEACQRPGLQCEITSKDSLHIAIQNRTDASVTVKQTAGTIYAPAKGDARLIALRDAEFTVPAKQAADATIPAVPLAAGAPGEPQAYHPTTDRELRLAPFLTYFASHNDVPRLTARLLVLCVIQDVTFAQWRQTLGENSAPEAAAQEVVAAIDALGVLRDLAPAQKFALATDPELKLRALRNPVARGKAMQLYGIALPDAPLPPDLGSLLHTKPGDNCPICRQRAMMLPRDDGL
jgi:hypothetical protein